MGNKKYYVAPGKAISISRGTASAGDAIEAKDLQSPVSLATAKEMTPEEILKFKEKQFQLLVDSKKCLLTTNSPDGKSEAVEFDLRKKEEKKPSSDKSGPDAGAKKK